MLGDLDPFDFMLASELKMTVVELHHRMSNGEYHAWAAFYVYRAEMRKLASKETT